MHWRDREESLIRAIVELFKRLGPRSEFRLSTPTGAAGVIIGDATWSPRLTKCQEIRRGKTFLILDEISMVGVNVLADISARIYMGKGNEQ